MKIGIVGYGVVGSAMARFFSRHSGREVAIYDKFLPSYNRASDKAAINRCELVFVCVPTPAAGMHCDTSAVEECVEWIEPPMCIRSTIIPGTVDTLVRRTGKSISFSPEYLGEAPIHPWHEEGDCGFLIVGGSPSLCTLVVSAFSNLPGVQLRWFQTTPRTAELCKYMENCFLATKVAFVNQFFDIAQAFNVDFAELRDLWLADPRIGASHTVVTPERGFRGRCLPKDLAALIDAMRAYGGAPILEAIWGYNLRLCGEVERHDGPLNPGVAGTSKP